MKTLEQVREEKKNLIVKEILAGQKKMLVSYSAEDNDSLMWITVLGEEYGEVCKSLNGLHLANLSNNPDDWHYFGQQYRQRLLQAASVALSMVESYDRNEGMNG